MFRRFAALLAPSRKTPAILDINAAYRVLGLSSPSSSPPTAEQARLQYLKLARQYHPDLTNGDDTKMKAINLAYEVVQRNAGSIASSPQQRPARRPKRRGDGDEDDGFGDDDDNVHSQRQEGKDGRNKRAPRSPLGDAASWHARPEFEWRSAIFDVPEGDATNARNQAHSYNRFFSFADDAAIFRAVRSGATVAEVARSMGRTPVAVEARMNSTQFKLRIQKLLKSGKQQSQQQQQQHQKRGGGLDARPEYARQVHPHHDTVYRTPAAERAPFADRAHNSDAAPFLYPEELGEDDEQEMGRFSARNLASAQGRSYSHLMQHMASARRK